MIAVNIMPTSIPVKRFVVKNSRIPRSFAPAAFSIPSLITFMPYRNRPSPPAIASNVETLIVCTSHFIKAPPSTAHACRRAFPYPARGYKPARLFLFYVITSKLTSSIFPLQYLSSSDPRAAPPYQISSRAARNAAGKRRPPDRTDRRRNHTDRSQAPCGPRR